MQAFATLLLVPWLFLSALLAGPACAQVVDGTAQREAIRFERLTVDDGLSQPSVYAILQDRDGFMWFGTQDGLNKYDGYTITVYRHNPDDPNSLSDNWVNTVYEDRNGTLWFCTDNGLNRFDRESESFTRFFYDPDNPFLTVSMLEDHTGTLWLGTVEHGLSKLVLNEHAGSDPSNAEDLGSDTASLTSFLHDPGNPNSLGDNLVFSLYEDSKQVLWIATNRGGLNRFDRATETFTRFVHTPDDLLSISANAISVIYEDRSGILWVGTRFSGLNRFDRATESFTRFVHNPDDPNSLGGNLVRAIHEDRTGALWIATGDGGLNRFDRQQETFTRFLHGPDDPHSLSNNETRALYEDRSGMLWVGTSNGALNRFDPEAGSFTHIQHDRTNPNSLNHNAVFAIYEDPAQPTVLWIGTKEGGLNRFDRRTGRVTHFLHDPDDPTSLTNNAVESIYRDRDGVLWVGTRDGLNRMNREGRSFTHLPDTSPDRPFKGVRFIYEAPAEPGALWLGTERGLIRFDKASSTFRSFQDTPHNPLWITAILEDHTGAFWMGSEGDGLTRFDRQTETFTPYRHDPGDPNSLRSINIFSIYEAPSGILWLGSGDGLSRFDIATASFTHFTEQNSDLPNDVVYGVLEDEDGHLWLSTLRGLSKFDPQTHTFHNYDIDRGLQARAFNSFAYHKGARGELFFGGVNGLNAFFPEQIRENSFLPEVVITDVKLFNQDPSPGETLSRPIRIAAGSAITLSHSEHDLLFEYVGLHYSNPSKNQYAYKLENYENDWHYVGAQRTATYTNLDAGTYVFRVIAANRDGIWNEKGASVRIVINPPWWKTAWAYALYVLLLVAGIVATDRFQRERLIRKERERAAIEQAELRAGTAEAQARALQAENERKQIALEKSKELKAAYQSLAEKNDKISQTLQHLKATQAQLIQAEKMASLGQLTAGIAHEIKNPLNFVNNFAEVCVELADELEDEIDDHRAKNLDAVADDLKGLLQEIKTTATKINEHGKRADGIVKSMLLHSRGTPGHRMPTDVNGLLEEYVNLSYHGMRAQVVDFNATIERRYDETLGKVSLVPQEIGRVFINLLNNAFYAVHQKILAQDGAAAPTVTVGTKNLGDRLEIRIRDSGTGIPAKLREKIFEPFFTTKPTGTGTGLGLSLSYDIIVQSYGGDFAVESEEGVFTEFIITLPK